jgi:hypothetical protein
MPNYLIPVRIDPYPIAILFTPITKKLQWKTSISQRRVQAQAELDEDGAI